jgi:hypothetical protein
VVKGEEKTMNGTIPRGGDHKHERFFSIVGDLQDDLKRLIRKEVDLAKAEIGENFSALGRNAGLAAGGAVLALFALFLLLLGIGAILARMLQAANLSPGAAYFISYTGLALLLGALGYFLIRKAVDAFSKISFSPDKALAGAKGAEPVPIEIRKAIENETNGAKEAKRSSEELQSEVIAARARMDEEVAELKSRLTPGYLIRSLFAGIKHHPTRALLFGASTGLGGYLYWRNKHIAEVQRLRAERKWWQFKVRKA